MMLAAVTPIPDTFSEFAFAGLLRGSKTVLADCLTHSLQVPAQAEIVLYPFNLNVLSVHLEKFL